MASSRAVRFTLVRLGGGRVYPVSLGSLGFLPGGVVVFLRVRWVHFGSPCGSFGSSEVVGFTRGRPVGHWIHLASLGSHCFALGIVVFIRCCWVHSGTSWRTLGSSSVVVFTRFRPGGRWVHPGSLNSLGHALGVTRLVRAIGFTQVNPGATGFIRGR